MKTLKKLRAPKPSNEQLYLDNLNSIHFKKLNNNYNMFSNVSRIKFINIRYLLIPNMSNINIDKKNNIKRSKSDIFYISGRQVLIKCLLYLSKTSNTIINKSSLQHYIFHLFIQNPIISPQQTLSKYKFYGYLFNKSFSLKNYIASIKAIFTEVMLTFKRVYKYSRIGFVKSESSELRKNMSEKGRHILTLNFKKDKFFPYLYSELDKQTLFNSSLGIFSRRFSPKKSFLRSKSSYLMSASFLRRLLLYLYLPVNTTLQVVKVPKYLTEILTTMFSQASTFHIDPVSGESVSESDISTRILFDFVIFTNNKCYGVVKKRKRGRVKRKISRKLFLYNNVAD